MTDPRRVLELPTEMRIAGSPYEILCFLKEDETRISSSMMRVRAKELEAQLDLDDAKSIWWNQEDIPKALRGEITFLFVGSLSPINEAHVLALTWSPPDDRWKNTWLEFYSSWDDDYRFLRPKET